MPGSCGIAPILMSPDLTLAFYVQYCLDVCSLSGYQFAFLAALNIPHCNCLLLLLHYAASDLISLSQAGLGNQVILVMEFKEKKTCIMKNLKHIGK